MAVAGNVYIYERMSKYNVCVNDSVRKYFGTLNILMSSVSTTQKSKVYERLFKEVMGEVEVLNQRALATVEELRREC